MTASQPLPVSVLLSPEAFAASVGAALEASGSVGQLVSVRIVERRTAPSDGGEKNHALFFDATTKLVEAAIRSDDIVGQWQPGHLVVSLPSASEASAKEIARRIRMAAQELAVMAPVFQGLQLEVSSRAVQPSATGLLDALLDAPDPQMIDLSTRRSTG